MLKQTSIIVLATAAVVLSGCASNASVAGMTYQYAGKKAMRNRALKDGMAVNQVKGGHETNALWVSKINKENFKAALNNSLKQAKLYHQVNNAKYHLNAIVFKQKQPIMGMTLTARLSVHYLLKNIQMSKVCYSKIINSTGRAGLGDAYLFNTRLRLANEGAGRENIQQLITALYHLPANC